MESFKHGTQQTTMILVTSKKLAYIASYKIPHLLYICAIEFSIQAHWAKRTRMVPFNYGGQQTTRTLEFS